MELEVQRDGTRAVAQWRGEIGAAEARSLGEAVASLPESLEALIVVLDEDARLELDALATFARIWRGFVRRELQTVIVGPRATQRDVARQILAEAEDATSTVTVSRAIAAEWLAANRRDRSADDTVSALEEVQSRMKTLRDTVG